MSSTPAPTPPLRVGIDLGGSKIAGFLASKKFV